LRKRVLWCLTGSGSFMHECSKGIAELARSGIDVEVCLSRAGEEVAKMYGVLSDLQAMGIKVLLERSSSGLEVAGRVASGRYVAIVVAPATSNTVAKIVLGVADTLPTIAASQALKNRLPLAILPSDYGDTVVTIYPCIVISSRCSGCGACASSCPTGAIAVDSSRARIDYSRCIGCGICAATCTSNAISCWDRSVYSCYSRDVSYVRTLERMNVKVFTSVNDILGFVRDVAGLSNPLHRHRLGLWATQASSSQRS